MRRKIGIGCSLNVRIAEPVTDTQLKRLVPFLLNWHFWSPLVWHVCVIYKLYSYVYMIYYTMPNKLFNKKIKDKFHKAVIQEQNSKLLIMRVDTNRFSRGNRCCVKKEMHSILWSGFQPGNKRSYHLNIFRVIPLPVQNKLIFYALGYFRFVLKTVF